MRFLLVLLFSFNLAAAQKFVYVSSPADDPLVSKLFLYANGQSTPLTTRPDDAAYDPTLLPDGTQIAYLEKTSSGWSLVVIDLSGEVVSSWELPNSQETMRPAGGFYPTWLDEDTLLAQAPSQDGWEVLEFTRDTAPKTIAEGFGIFISPNKQQLLTNAGGYLVRLDIVTGQTIPMTEGDGWGWLDDTHVIVFQDGSLYNLSLTGDTSKLADLNVQSLVDVSASPDRSAIVVVEANDDGFFISVYKNQARLARQPLGPTDTLQWSDDETLLLSYQKGEADSYDSVIATMTLDGTLTELVNSDGSDYMAKPIE
jgi:hypothetical protein